MKKLILLYIIYPTFAAAQSGCYELRGQMQQPHQGYVYVSHAGGVDSAAVRGGAFVLRGRVAAPEAVRLYVAKPGELYGKNPETHSLPLYLEPGIITLQSSDSLTHATLGGTPRNVAQNDLNQALEPVIRQCVAAMNAYYLASPAQQQDTARMRGLQRQAAVAQVAWGGVVRQFIRQHPTSPVSLAALDTHATRLTPAEREMLFNGLAPAVRQSQPGMLYARQLARAKAVAVGAVAPDFTQTDPAGNPVSLRDFRGQYVLLDFWASWCGPCRQVNPNMVALYQHFKSRNFTILSVSLDQDRKGWLDAIDQDHLTWPQVSDLKFWKNEVAKLYAIEFIPQQFLIGPDGRILAKNLSGQELGDLLSKTLPQSRP